METIDIPVSWISAHGHTAVICSRHGAATEEIRETRFRQRWAGWIGIAAVASGVLGVLLGVAVTPMLAPLPVIAFVVFAKAVWTSIEAVWPYCTRCIALHRVDVAARVLAVVTVAGAFVAARRLRADGVDGVTLALASGVLLSLVVVFLLRETFSWQRLAGAHLSRDGQSVRVKAHARFAAVVRARLGDEPAPDMPSVVH